MHESELKVINAQVPDGTHNDYEYLHYYGTSIKLHNSGDGRGYYFFPNAYYGEGNNRRFLPAYGVVYDLERTENEEGEPQVLVNYKADYPDRASRRNALFYWTSVVSSANPMKTDAKTLRLGSFFDDELPGYASTGRVYETFKYAALPVRCVK